MRGFFIRGISTNTELRLNIYEVKYIHALEKLQGGLAGAIFKLFADNELLRNLQDVNELFPGN